MSDTPPPELVAIARGLHLARFDDWDSCDCADDELLDADTLAALAEWADGALIDPVTWTRWDRDEVGSGWYRNRLTGELSPWGDDEPCPPENRVYTLTPRGGQ